MLLKNTLRTFKLKIFQLFAVGIVIFLSSFIYTTMFYGINAVKEPAEMFFSQNKQENFSVDTINILMQNELEFAVSKYGMTPGIYTLANIKNENEKLFYEIINARKNLFEEKYTKYELELREYKDLEIDNNNNKIRIIKNSEKINIPMIE